MKGRFPFLLFIGSFISSFSVLSQEAVKKTGIPATPADFLTWIGGVFDGLSGKAAWKDLYWLTPILYFVIFVAIWFEAIRLTPIFGPKGEVNRVGKWFVAAAAGLSTLGVFFAERAGGQTLQEVAKGLILPFGIWGATILAIILAFIIFKWIRDSNIFGEEITVPIAVSVALALILIGFFLSVDYFFSWGFLIAIIGAVVGLFMKFAESRKEAAELREGGMEKGFWGNIRAKGEAEPEKTPEKLSKHLYRALRRVYQFNRRSGRDLYKAKHAAEGGKLNEVVGYLEEAKKYENREMDFDALALELGSELEKLARKFPAHEEKLKALVDSIPVALKDLKRALDEAERLAAANSQTDCVKELAAAVKFSGQIEKDIEGAEAEAVGLGRMLAAEIEAERHGQLAEHRFRTDKKWYQFWKRRP